jgi:hypothetical protein
MHVAVLINVWCLQNLQLQVQVQCRTTWFWCGHGGGVDPRVHVMFHAFVVAILGACILANGTLHFLYPTVSGVVTLANFYGKLMSEYFHCVYWCHCFNKRNVALFLKILEFKSFESPAPQVKYSGILWDCCEKVSE